MLNPEDISQAEVVLAAWNLKTGSNILLKMLTPYGWEREIFKPKSFQAWEIYHITMYISKTVELNTYARVKMSYEINNSLF